MLFILYVVSTTFVAPGSHKMKGTTHSISAVTVPAACIPYTEATIFSELLNLAKLAMT